MDLIAILGSAADDIPYEPLNSIADLLTNTFVDVVAVVQRPKLQANDRGGLDEDVEYQVTEHGSIGSAHEDTRIGPQLLLRAQGQAASRLTASSCWMDRIVLHY